MRTFTEHAGALGCIPVWPPGGPRAFLDKGQPDGTGDRRQALPATGHPGPTPGSQDHGDIRGHRRARRVSEPLTAARRPPVQLSPKVIDTPGPALPSPRGSPNTGC